MNYDSINEIFSSGTANMTCLLRDSNDYDGGTFALIGADFLIFNGHTVPNVYAHGDSCWGFGTDSVYLKVDNRDTRMCSLYCEEGTLYSYYKFLKIRWEGWSHFSSSGAEYQLKYDLVLWDTGGISLHMVSVPVQCYDGRFELIADKKYTFTKPDVNSPDVTFHYSSELKAYEIQYTPVYLSLPFKLLIKDNTGVFYTIEKQVINDEVTDVLVKLEETEPNALLLKTKGFAEFPDWDLIKDLEIPSVLSWSESRAFPLSTVITGTTPKQYVECTADLSDETVLGIKALNAEYSGDVTAQYSYDGENFTDEIHIADFLTSDLDALYAGLTDTKSITFRFWLSGDASLKTFIMNYRNGDDDDA